MKLDKSSHLYGLYLSQMKQRIFGCMCFIFSAGVCLAHGDTSPDFMRSIGKIYTVAAVCLLILLTLLILVIRLDRRLGKIEKRQKNE